MILTEEKQKAYECFKSQNWYKRWEIQFGLGREWRGRITIEQFLNNIPISLWGESAMLWHITNEGRDYWYKISNYWAVLLQT